MDYMGQKFRCSTHPDHPLCLLDYGKQQLMNSRFLCVKCIIELTKINANVSQTMPIEDFLKEPSLVLGDKAKQFAVIDKGVFTMRIGEYLEELKSIIVTQITEFKLAFNNLIKEHKGKIKEQGSLQAIWENSIGYQKFKQQFQMVISLDSHQGSKEWMDLQEHFGKIVEKIHQNQQDEKENDKFKNIQKQTFQALLDLIYGLDRNLKAFQLKIHQQLGTVQNNILNKLMPDQEFCDKLIQTISNGKQIIITSIYEGVKVGVDVKKYYQKCDQQGHLLTVFRQKNGTIFGGYSPSKVDSKLCNYVPDDSLSSFIYQYNKRQIFKQKYKNYALYCNPQYGPSYGGGFDLCVQSNTAGYSNLGHTYNTEGLDIPNKKFHMFGGEEKPDIVDCYIFQIKFL
ncbi:hypothetical protein pb186bvf_007450 [Paramecium bursaria]